MLPLTKLTIPENLRSTVQCAFFCGVDNLPVLSARPRTYRLPPTGCLDIVIRACANGSYSCLITSSGLQSRLITIPADVWYVGVRLQVHAARTVQSLPPAELVGRRNDLGHVSNVARRALLDADLSSPNQAISSLFRVISESIDRSATSPDERLVIAVNRCLDASSVSLLEICREVGIAERSLRRWSVDWTGWSPKQLQRIGRCASAVRVLQQSRLPISHVASDFGFSDQAHLNRECRSLYGLTPAQLRSEAIET